MRREQDNLIDKKLESFVNPNTLESFFLLAGAGAGKTRSLVNTLHYIQQNHGKKLKKDSKKIAVVTYTKAASEEIKSRINFDTLFEVSTLHSFSWGIIQYFQRDIKDYLTKLAIVNLEALNNTIDERFKKNLKPLKKDIDNINKWEKKLEISNRVNKFYYSPDLKRNNSNSAYLNHNEVLDIMREFLEKRVVFQQVFVKKYPILFIDECQDTNKSLMDVFLDVEKTQNDFCLGLFGDMMQQIYNDGKSDLKDVISDWKNQPQKEMNWRSQKRIVDFINVIRKHEDGLTQYHSKDKLFGTVKIFIRPNNLENIQIVESEMKNNFIQDIKGNDKEIHSLILEHRMAAKRNGFLNLYDTLNTQPTKELLVDASGKEFKFIKDIIIRIYNIHSTNDTLSLLQMVRNEKTLNEKELEWNDLINISAKLKIFMDLFKMKDTLALRKYILKLNEINLFEIPNMLKEEYQEDPSWENWNKALECPLEEFIKLFDYKSKIDNYVTQQGSKGLEYNNVMVVINDHEKKGSLFNYEKLFDIEGLSDRDHENIENEKDNTQSRTRRLLYVACSRAKENLALVIYTRDVNKAKDFFIKNSYATSEEINTEL